LVVKRAKFKKNISSYLSRLIVFDWSKIIGQNAVQYFSTALAPVVRTFEMVQGSTSTDLPIFSAPPKPPIYKTVWFVAVICTLSIFVVIGGGIGVYFKFFHTSPTQKPPKLTKTPQKYVQFYKDHKSFFEKPDLTLQDFTPEGCLLVQEFCLLKDEERDKILQSSVNDLRVKLDSLCSSKELSDNLATLSKGLQNIGDLSHTSISDIANDAFLCTFMGPELSRDFAEFHKPGWQKFFEANKESLFTKPISYLQDIPLDKIPALLEFCAFPPEDKDKIISEIEKLSPKNKISFEAIYSSSSSESFKFLSNAIKALVNVPPNYSDPELLKVYKIGNLRSLFDDPAKTAIEVIPKEPPPQAVSLFKKYDKVLNSDLLLSSISDTNFAVEALQQFCNSDKKFPLHFNPDKVLRLGKICDEIQKEPNFLSQVFVPAVEAIKRNDFENPALKPFFSDNILINLIEEDKVKAFFAPLFTTKNFADISDVELFLQKCKMFKGSKRDSDQFLSEPDRPKFKRLLDYFTKSEANLRNAITSAISNNAKDPSLSDITGDKNLKKFLSDVFIKEVVQNKFLSDVSKIKSDYETEYSNFVQNLNSLYGRPNPEEYLKDSEAINRFKKFKSVFESRKKLDKDFKEGMGLFSNKCKILEDELKVELDQNKMNQAEDLRRAHNFLNPNARKEPSIRKSLFTFYNHNVEEFLRNSRKGSLEEKKEILDKAKTNFLNAQTLCVDPKKYPIYSFPDLQTYLESLVSPTRIDEVKAMDDYEKQKREAIQLYNYYLALRKLKVNEDPEKSLVDFFGIDFTAKRELSPTELEDKKGRYQSSLNSFKLLGASFVSSDLSSLQGLYDEIFSQDSTFDKNQPSTELCPYFHKQFVEKLKEPPSSQMASDLNILFGKVKVACQPSDSPDEYKFDTLNAYLKTLFNLDKIKNDIKAIPNSEKKNMASEPFRLIQILIFLKDTDYIKYENQSIEDIFEILSEKDYKIFLDNILKNGTLTSDEFDNAKALQNTIQSSLSTTLKGPSIILCPQFSQNLQTCLENFLLSPTKAETEFQKVQKSFDFAKIACSESKANLYEPLKHATLQDYFYSKFEETKNLPCSSLEEYNLKSKKADEISAFLEVLVKKGDPRVLDYKDKTKEQIYNLVKPLSEEEIKAQEEERKAQLRSSFNGLVPGMFLQNMEEALIQSFCNLSTQDRAYAVSDNIFLKALNHLCSLDFKKILEHSNKDKFEEADYRILSPILNETLLEPLIDPKLVIAIRQDRHNSFSPDVETSFTDLKNLLSNKDLVENLKFFLFSKDLDQLALGMQHEILEEGLIDLITKFNPQDKKNLTQGNDYLVKLKANRKFYGDRIVFKYDSSGKSSFENLPDCKFYAFLKNLGSDQDAILKEFRDYFKDPIRTPILLKKFKWLFQYAPSKSNINYLCNFALNFSKVLQNIQEKGYLEAVNDFYKIFEEYLLNPKGFYSFDKLFTLRELAISRKTPDTPVLIQIDEFLSNLLIQPSTFPNHISKMLPNEVVNGEKFQMLLAMPSKMLYKDIIDELTAFTKGDEVLLLRYKNLLLFHLHELHKKLKEEGKLIDSLDIKEFYLFLKQESLVASFKIRLKLFKSNPHMLDYSKDIFSYKIFQWFINDSVINAGTELRTRMYPDEIPSDEDDSVSKINSLSKLVAEFKRLNILDVLKKQVHIGKRKISFDIIIDMHTLKLILNEIYSNTSLAPMDIFSAVRALSQFCSKDPRSKGTAMIHFLTSSTQFNPPFPKDIWDKVDDRLKSIETSNFLLQKYKLYLNSAIRLFPKDQTSFKNASMLLIDLRLRMNPQPDLDPIIRKIFCEGDKNYLIELSNIKEESRDKILKTLETVLIELPQADALYIIQKRVQLGKEQNKLIEATSISLPGITLGIKLPPNTEHLTADQLALLNINTQKYSEISKWKELFSTPSPDQPSPPFLDRFSAFVRLLMKMDASFQKLKPKYQHRIEPFKIEDNFFAWFSDLIIQVEEYKRLDSISKELAILEPIVSRQTFSIENGALTASPGLDLDPKQSLFWRFYFENPAMEFIRDEKKFISNELKLIKDAEAELTLLSNQIKDVSSSSAFQLECLKALEAENSNIQNLIKNIGTLKIFARAIPILEQRGDPIETVKQQINDKLQEAEGNIQKIKIDLVGMKLFKFIENVFKVKKDALKKSIEVVQNSVPETEFYLEIFKLISLKKPLFSLSDIDPRLEALAIKFYGDRLEPEKH
jgi:hypothetical protein